MQQQHLAKSQSKKVSQFIHSIGRNSSNTEHLYNIGLVHFDRFLKSNDTLSHLAPDTVIQAIQKQQINVYELLDQFVSYLLTKNLSIPSVKLYIAAIRSYLEFYDIDIVSSKFRRRVKIPKHYRDDELPLDISDIRNLIIQCHNKRLKTLLLVLVSSGVRVMEACTLRTKDVDFSISPTKIYIRKEFSKTRRAREVYISDEAAKYLQELINSKPNQNPDDLIFSKLKESLPRSIYFRLLTEFEKLLTAAGMDEKKDNSPRRKVTLHSFRRFVKGVVSDQAGQDYSEWFLGHNHSVYWTRKEQEHRNIYLKCMPHLTVLDYSQLDTRSKNIETALIEKDKAIQQLRQSDTEKNKQIEEMISKQEQFEQLIQSLIDSGQLKPV